MAYFKWKTLLTFKKNKRGIFKIGGWTALLEIININIQLHMFEKSRNVYPLKKSPIFRSEFEGVGSVIGMKSCYTLVRGGQSYKMDKDL